LATELYRTLSLGHFAMRCEVFLLNIYADRVSQK